jgi:hypothetical protein
MLAEVGAQHRAAGLNAFSGQYRLETGGRQMDDGNRVANQRQRPPDALEYLLLFGHGEVTGLAARGDAQARQVSG